MAGKPNMLALLLGGKPSGKGSAKPKPKGVSREDLKTAMRDFRNAADDDAAVTALMNFNDLVSDYQPDN